ncbi:class I SAM-dependent methyltransferase [Thiohalobacter thiocyanaticus]|uniref:Class I SAM-dependent methyltransferase n=1 Tax=Thiohalobacter thiocyanaticus TaxID=585455 RepID=A0A426QIR2_9GAMM|nr:class I SAM-dependent methyltransferase [Thiohalobacter thiocyanaticus]RRQ21649.1 class I SAM-dependent methyltransferase [Thiohalobacter thiocyanaticus]
MSIREKTLRWLVVPMRLITAMSYYRGDLQRVSRWLIASREHTNFTYNLTNLNRRYMARFLGIVCDETPEVMAGYLREVLEDEKLKEHIAKLTRESDRNYLADDEPRYARRIGWYAIVRAQKPAMVVETGVDKGLGSCLLAAALMKNSEEGKPGYLYGTDINPKAGYLLQAPYNQFGKVLYGDSIESLNELEGTIDLFINDSDHSTDYEMREYEAVEAKLSPNAIIIGDNSHFSDKLINFSERSNRDFLFFQERPENHWYPGGGIGVAYQRR